MTSQKLKDKISIWSSTLFIKISYFLQLNVYYLSLFKSCLTKTTSIHFSFFKKKKYLYIKPSYTNMKSALTEFAKTV